MIKITDSNREKILKFKDMLRNAYYADGGQVTEVYNEVFGARERPTNCGTCIRQRMNALVEALEAIDRKLEELSRKEEKVQQEASEEAKEDSDGNKAEAEKGAAKKGRKSKGK